jgi:hypothetical protein
MVIMLFIGIFMKIITISVLFGVMACAAETLKACEVNPTYPSEENTNLSNKNFSGILTMDCSLDDPGLRDLLEKYLETHPHAVKRNRSSDETESAESSNINKNEEVD